jgi:hypothetical protein
VSILIRPHNSKNELFYSQIKRWGFVKARTNRSTKSCCYGHPNFRRGDYDRCMLLTCSTRNNQQHIFSFPPALPTSADDPLVNIPSTSITRQNAPASPQNFQHLSNMDGSAFGGKRPPLAFVNEPSFQSSTSIPVLSMGGQALHSSTTPAAPARLNEINTGFIHPSLSTREIPSEARFYPESRSSFYRGGRATNTIANTATFSRDQSMHTASAARLQINSNYINEETSLELTLAHEKRKRIQELMNLEEQSRNRALNAYLFSSPPMNRGPVGAIHNNNLSTPTFGNNHEFTREQGQQFLMMNHRNNAPNITSRKHTAIENDSHISSEKKDRIIREAVLAMENAHGWN